MSKEQEQQWQWSSLDPMTRIVVAGFTGRIGEAEGDISGDDFVASMTETFGMPAEDVIKTVAWSGGYGTRNIIAARLSVSERESVKRMVQNLGQLAGGTEAVIALATQAGQFLRTPSGEYDAIPALQVLSELAIKER